MLANIRISSFFSVFLPYTVFHTVLLFYLSFRSVRSGLKRPELLPEWNYCRISQVMSFQIRIIPYSPLLCCAHRDTSSFNDSWGLKKVLAQLKLIHPTENQVTGRLCGVLHRQSPLFFLSL